jgi:hypothetical protein
MGFELTHQVGEGLGESRLASPTAAILRAGAEEVVKSLTSVAPEPAHVYDGWRFHRVEDHAADALRMLAHERKREIGAVGDPEHVPLRDSERLAQVGEVGGVLSRVVGAELAPRRRQAKVAGSYRRSVQTSGRRSIQRQAEAAHEELVDLRARQRRLGVQSPSLVHQDEIAVAVQACINEYLRLKDRDAARAAGQVNDWVGLRRRRTSGDDRDDEPNGAAGRLAAIFRHDKVTTARFGQRRQCRTR